jgi:hypothetical protein
MSNDNEQGATGADDFADLGAWASETDGAAEAQARAHEAQQLAQVENTAASMVDDLTDVLKMARGMAAPAFAWWPEFERVWGDSTLYGIAVNGAAIMARHGWTMGQLMTQWGPYLGLLGCTLPPALATFKAIQERRNVRHEQTQP